MVTMYTTTTPPPPPNKKKPVTMDMCVHALQSVTMYCQGCANVYVSTIQKKVIVLSWRMYGYYVTSGPITYVWHSSPCNAD